MYGVSDFDPAVVASLVAREHGAINEQGMLCPLRGHGERLRWHKGRRRSGTEWHADPAVRFHASPTYVLRQREENVIAGRALLSGALTGKAETQRLGHENSEDALSWNVFRALQEAGALRLAVEALSGSLPEEEPDLYLWGRQITRTGVQPWEALARARAQLEPGLAQQTEPDVCLHVAGFGWLFVEAKFGSPTSVARTDTYLQLWRERYRQRCGDLFIWRELDDARAADVPEQLLRNAAFARHVADSERAMVVALVREVDVTPVEERFRRFCAADAVDFGRATWESIYRLLVQNADAQHTSHVFREEDTEPATRLPPERRIERLLGSLRGVRCRERRSGQWSHLSRSFSARSVARRPSG